MQKLLVAVLLILPAIAGAQVSPPSWFTFWDWMRSLNSNDLAAHTKFLTERMQRVDTKKEAIAEMKFRNSVGGELKLYKFVTMSDAEMHAILKGQDGLSWADVIVRTTPEGHYITAVELHPIPAPKYK